MVEFSIDSAALGIPCPVCAFWNPATIRQVRIRDVIICRGCKCNIQLDDYMNEARRAERDMRRTFGDLLKGLDGLGDIVIKL